MKRFAGGVGMLLALGAAGLVLVLGCHRESSTPNTTLKNSAAAAAPVMVTVARVEARQVERMVGLVGTLHGFEEVSLGAEVSGRVRRILHDVADRVAPGELLLEIESTDYELRVRQAQKALQVELARLGLTELPGPQFDITQVPTVVQAALRRDHAKNRLERSQLLAARRATSEEELAERMSEYRVAIAEYDNQILIANAGVAAIAVKQEELAQARQDLLDTRVRVPLPSQPVPGVEGQVQYAIADRLVAEGSYVSAGEPLFDLVIDRPLRFRGTVPERKAGEVRLGQTVYVVSAAYEQPFAGEVTRINPAINPQTRTFEVEVLVPNTNSELKPGGFAKAGIITSIDPQAATVPIESLVNFAGVTKIFLVEDGRAREVQVTLGEQAIAWVEIASPKLTPGMQVVTSGQTALADGMTVALRKPPVQSDGKHNSEQSPSADGELARRVEQP